MGGQEALGRRLEVRRETDSHLEHFPSRPSCALSRLVLRASLASDATVALRQDHQPALEDSATSGVD